MSTAEGITAAGADMGEGISEAKDELDEAARAWGRATSEKMARRGPLRWWQLGQIYSTGKGLARDE